MDKETRRQVIAEAMAERQRLLPRRDEATQTTIGLMRQSTGQSAELVPYLNMAYIQAVRQVHGEDGLLAFALSLANWAVAAIDEVAQYTDRTAEQVIDQYETSIMEVRQFEEEAP